MSYSNYRLASQNFKAFTHTPEVCAKSSLSFREYEMGDFMSGKDEDQ